MCRVQTHRKALQCDNEPGRITEAVKDDTAVEDDTWDLLSLLLMLCRGCLSPRYVSEYSYSLHTHPTLESLLLRVCTLRIFNACTKSVHNMHPEYTGMCMEYTISMHLGVYRVCFKAQRNC